MKYLVMKTGDQQITDLKSRKLNRLRSIENKEYRNEDIASTNNENDEIQDRISKATEKARILKYICIQERISSSEQQKEVGDVVKKIVRIFEGRKVGDLYCRKTSTQQVNTEIGHHSRHQITQIFLKHDVKNVNTKKTQ